MVRVIKTWEHVDFEASKKEGAISCKIELMMNHQQGTYVLMSPNQDQLVELSGDSIEELELNLEAIKRAVRYVKENLSTLPASPEK